MVLFPQLKDYKENELRKLYDVALTRKRVKLQYETVNTYVQFVDLVHRLNPAWQLCTPPILGNGALSAAWPDKAHIEEILQWLKDNGSRDGKDLLAGACVPLALFCGRLACQMLQEDVLPATVAREFHGRCLGYLKGLPAKAQAEFVFGDLKQRGWKLAQSLWDPELKEDKCVFGTAAFESQIKHAMAQNSRTVVPGYVVVYIFDGDELGRREMLRTDQETAQYSIHCMSFVVDPGTQSIVLADPNAGLKPGSNIEFVSIPTHMRLRYHSTKISSHDIQQMEFKNSLKLRRRENKKQGKVLTITRQQTATVRVSAYKTREFGRFWVQPKASTKGYQHKMLPSRIPIWSFFSRPTIEPNWMAPDGKSCGAVTALTIGLLAQGVDPSALDDMLRGMTSRLVRQLLTYSIHSGCVVTPDMVRTFSVASEQKVEAEQKVEEIWCSSRDGHHFQEWVRHNDGNEELFLRFKDAECLIPDQPNQESYFSDEIINMLMLLVRKWLRNQAASTTKSNRGLEALQFFFPPVIANIIAQYNDYGPTCIMNSFFLTKAQQPEFKNLIRWLQNSLALTRPIDSHSVEIPVPFSIILPANCGTSQIADHWVAIKIRVTGSENNEVNVWPGFSGRNRCTSAELDPSLNRAIGVLQEAVANLWQDVVSGEESESETEPDPENSWNRFDNRPTSYDGYKLIPNSHKFHEGSRRSPHGAPSSWMSDFSDSEPSDPDEKHRRWQRLPRMTMTAPFARSLRINVAPPPLRRTASESPPPVDVLRLLLLYYYYY